MCRLATCQKKPLKQALNKIAPLFKKHWVFNLEEINGTLRLDIVYPYRKIPKKTEITLYNGHKYLELRILFDDATRPHQITRISLRDGRERIEYNSIADLITFLRSVLNNKT